MVAEPGFSENLMRSTTCHRQYSDEEEAGDIEVLYSPTTLQNADICRVLERRTSSARSKPRPMRRTFQAVRYLGLSTMGMLRCFAIWKAVSTKLNSAQPDLEPNQCASKAPQDVHAHLPSYPFLRTTPRMSIVHGLGAVSWKKSLVRLHRVQSFALPTSPANYGRLHVCIVSP